MTSCLTCIWHAFPACIPQWDVTCRPKTQSAVAETERFTVDNKPSVSSKQRECWSKPHSVPLQVNKMDCSSFAVFRGFKTFLFFFFFLLLHICMTKIWVQVAAWAKPFKSEREEEYGFNKTKPRSEKRNRSIVSRLTNQQKWNQLKEANI